MVKKTSDSNKVAVSEIIEAARLDMKRYKNAEKLYDAAMSLSAIENSAREFETKKNELADDIAKLSAKKAKAERITKSLEESCIELEAKKQNLGDEIIDAENVIRYSFAKTTKVEEQALAKFKREANAKMKDHVASCNRKVNEINAEVKDKEAKVVEIRETLSKLQSKIS